MCSILFEFKLFYKQHSNKKIRMHSRKYITAKYIECSNYKYTYLHYKVSKMKFQIH